MTVINPNSISGITSITLPSGDSNVLTIHTSDGVERFRIDSSGNVKVGSACTISQDGDVFFTGVTTATTFTGAHSGSGANLTSLPAGNLTGALPAISGANLTGIAATDNVRTGILDVAGVSTFRNTMNVGAAVTISESGIEASGIGITCANINGGQIGGRRNKIINGAMSVAQRGTSSTDNGIKTVDRWNTSKSGMDQLAFTQKQVSDSPNGYSYSYEVDITTAETAQAGDEYMRVEQKIEAQDLQDLAYGTSGAKSVTVSFWVKSYQTGNYVVNFYAQDGNRQITRTYTVNASATWEYKSVTIPGDTSGTINNDTGSGLHLAFPIIADSGYLTTDSTSWINYTDGGYAYGQTVNLGSSTDNYWKITGVQLEVGSQATAFEHRSVGDELSLCERYYQLIMEDDLDGNGRTGGVGGTPYSDSSSVYCPILFRCRMRTKPSLESTASSTFRTRRGNSANFNGFSGFNDASDHSGTIITNGNAGGGDIGAYIWVETNSGAKLALDAEI